MSRGLLLKRSQHEKANHEAARVILQQPEQYPAGLVDWARAFLSRENGDYVSNGEVSAICNDSASLPKVNESGATHATDFDPPIYNIWKQQEFHFQG